MGTVEQTPVNTVRVLRSARLCSRYHILHKWLLAGDLQLREPSHRNLPARLHNALAIDVAHPLIHRRHGE